MKFELKYGSQPVVFPELSEKALLSADAVALRVLLLLAAEPTLRAEGRDALANRLGLTPAEADGAIAYWQSQGILKKSSGKSAKSAESGAEKLENTSKTEKSGGSSSKPSPKNDKKDAKPEKRTKLGELPAYTDGELADILERKKNLTDLITEAQNALGKIFNLNETKILVSIVEELGFDEEFMLILLDFCRRSERKNLRYVEKLAASLYDDGIRDAEALTDCLRRREQLQSAEGKVRAMFGLGSRALTEKEKGHIARWIDTYGFDFPMIEKAYEITVNSTSKPSLSYANKILENWYTEGIKTPEDADAARGARNGEKTVATTFDVDDFFKTALERSYREFDGSGN